MKKILTSKPISADVGLLILRLAVGAFMLTHGWGKLANFSAHAESFYDPFGIGGTASKALVVFAEFFCSIMLILGVYTRAFVIPLIVTMLVAAFGKHFYDSFGDKEFALLYLGAYITIFLAGSGKYSITK